MSTQNNRPDGELDLTQFNDHGVDREPILWPRLNEAVQPLSESTTDFDRETSDDIEPCPLCGFDLTHTPLHKHLPHCDDPEGEYQDA